MDETDPKSKNLPVCQLIAHVEHLSGQSNRCFASPEDRLSLEMLTAARLLDLTGLRCSKGSVQTDSFAAFLDLMDTCLKDFAHAAISCLRSLRLPLSKPFAGFSYLFRRDSIPGITLAFDRRCCYEEGIYTDIDHPRRNPCETYIYLFI